MQCSQIHCFYPNEEGEQDDDDEDECRAQRELDHWVEEQKNFEKPAYCNRNNKLVEIFSQKCVICFKISVFMHSGIVVINVFVKVVIKIKAV